MSEPLYTYQFNSAERATVFAALILLIKSKSTDERKGLAHDCLREMGIEDAEVFVQLLDMEPQFA